MRLIVEYQSGDGFSYSHTCTHAIVYESKEKFLRDFERVCLDSAKRQAHCTDFLMANQWFSVADFRFDVEEILLPEVYTVDEWFEYHG